MGAVPVIRVTPTAHAFPSVAVGDARTVEVRVSNAGTAPLAVTRVALDATSSPAFAVASSPSLPRVVAPQASFQLEIRYRPTDGGQSQGALVVGSNDPAHPEVYVNLTTLERAPDIVVEPAQIDFGVVSVRGSRILGATIRNVGFADLIVSEIVGPAGGQMALTAQALPAVVAPGDSVQLLVAYRPTVCGRHEGDFRIRSNDPDEAEVALPARGRTPGPVLEVSENPVDLGPVVLGAGAVGSLSISNPGTSALVLGTIAIEAGGAPGFSVQPASLAVYPGQQREITIGYRPAVAGSARATLLLRSNDCEVPEVRVPLRAVGADDAAPLIEVTPLSVSFGNVPVTLDAQRTISVRNLGRAPLTVSSFTYELGTPSEFSLADDRGFTLPGCATPPCAARTLTLRYAPTDEGVDRGTLVVHSDGVNDPAVRVLLDGTGTARPTCVLTPQVAVVDFGDVAVGGSGERTVVVANTGDGDCEYNRTTRLSPSSPDFSVDGQPARGVVVPPGGTFEVGVRFSPAVAGTHGGRLSIRATDPHDGNSYVVTEVRLEGRGTEPRIEVVPPSLDLGLALPGCSSKILFVTIYSVGQDPLVLHRIFLQGQLSRFQIHSAPPPGTVLAPGESAEVQLRFHPIAAGPVQDVLVIESSDGQRPRVEVPLTGRGAAGPTVVDKFVQSLVPKVDLLFVVDNSPSMRQEQDMLRTNFEVLARHAAALEADYQIGVVTTDSPLLRGNPKIIRPTDPDPVTEFRANAAVGDVGNSRERGLEMAYQALSVPLVDGSNRGFLRDDAALEIIVLSDEPDQSPRTPAFYLSFFRGLKGGANTDLFRLSAIVGDVPGGCTFPGGGATAGTGYVDVAQGSGGVVASICDSDFATHLRTIGDGALIPPRQFFLSSTPDLSQPMVVRRYPSEAACNADPGANAGSVVEADPIAGYRYDAASNSVVFSRAAAPQRGECIQVKYHLVCMGT